MKHTAEPSPVMRQWVRPLLIGTAVGIIACTAVMLLMTLVLQHAEIPRRAVMPMAVAAAAVGSFLAGLVAARLARQNGLLLGALCGSVLYLLVLAAGLLHYAGVGIGFAAVKAGMMLVAGALGGILGVNRRHR